MGTIIEAKCKCGFTSGDIYQGGGMSNFQKIDMEPAICRKCKKFLVLDYKLKENKCPYCGTIAVFYNDRSIQALPDGNIDAAFSTLLPSNIPIGNCL